jgi:hypothetical protein
VLKCDYREDELEIWPRPSGVELATLAARLARSGRESPKQLVDRAWELYWESCRKLQADYRAMEAYHAEMARLDEEPDGAEAGLPAARVPVPKKYPLKPRQVETLLLPKQKGRTAERASLIREYFFCQLVSHCLLLRPKVKIACYWELEAEVLEKLREQLRGQVVQHFERYQKTVFTAEAYAKFAVPFLTWHRRYIARKKSAAARKRWGKNEGKPEAEPQ